MPLQNAVDAPSNIVNPKISNVTLANNPLVIKSTGAAASTSQGDTNIWSVGSGLLMECFNTISTTSANPVLSTTAAFGLNINNVVAKVSGGIELTEGALLNSKSQFVAQTSAAFYVQASFNVNTTASCTEFFVGFRKAQAYNATLTNYTDYATIGVHGTAAKLQIQSQIGSGGNVVTDTTQTITAVTTFTLRVNVSSAGVVTYLINGAAPSATAAYTFSALNVVPFIWYQTPAGGNAEANFISYQCGLQ